MRLNLLKLKFLFHDCIVKIKHKFVCFPIMDYLCKKVKPLNMEGQKLLHSDIRTLNTIANALDADIKDLSVSDRVS